MCDTMKLARLLLFGSIILNACQPQRPSAPEAHALPILGEKEYNPRTGDTAFYSVKGFRLQDSNGKQNTDNDLATDRVHVLSFFFTRCPSVCPALNSHLKTVSDRFEDDNSVALHSISIDPEYDTQDELTDYKSRTGIANANWSFYTGEKRAIFDLAKNCKLKAFETGSDYTGLVHEPHLVLLDGQKRIRGYYNGLEKQSIQQLIADIERLKSIEGY